MGLLARRRLGERQGQNTVLRRGFDGVGLQMQISVFSLKVYIAGVHLRGLREL